MSSLPLFIGLALGALAIALGGFLIWRGKLQIQHPVRAFAVLCVAVISGFIMWMRYWQLQVLSSSDWCNRAMKAEQLDLGSRLDAAMACVGLQTVQIKAIATNSFIDGGTLAGCLLTLIVIVIAQGRLNFKVDKTGASGSIGKDEIEAAELAGAQQVAQAAEEKKDEIEAGAPAAASPDKGKFTPPPGEQL